MVRVRPLLRRSSVLRGKKAIKSISDSQPHRISNSAPLATLIQTFTHKPFHPSGDGVSGLVPQIISRKLFRRPSKPEKRV